MKKLFILESRLLVSSLFLFFVGVNTFSQRKQWVPLFSGVDLKGWEILSDNPDGDEQYWTVVDSTIALYSMDNSHSNVWLATKECYSQFEISMKFAIYRSAKGKSGLCFWSSYDVDSNWLNGPQVKLNSKFPSRTGFVWDATECCNRWIAPDLLRHRRSNVDSIRNNTVLNYSDEDLIWNELSIKAKGWNVHVWVNGRKVVSLKGKTFLTDSCHIANNVSNTGRFALQLSEGDKSEMYFKDIFIRSLDRNRQMQKREEKEDL